MKKYRLQSIFIVPFIIQIVIAISIVGYFSWRNEQRAVEDIVSHLQFEITSRVQQRITTFVEAPLLLNKINAEAISSGNLTAIDPESEKYLLNLHQLFSTVGAIQFALEENGQYLGIVQAEPDEPPYFQFRDETTDNRLHFYTINANGTQDELFKVSDNEYDPRQRPWYTDAVARGRPRWGEIEPAKAMAQGKWPQTVEVKRQDEVGELAQSFNKMAEQIQNSVTLLQCKIAEQQTIEDALRQSEEKYRTLVETADDDIILVNMDGKRLFFNEAYHRNLGYTAEEIKQIPVMEMVHPEDLPILMGMDQLFKSQLSVSLEYRVKCKDGSWAHRLAKSVLMKDQHGRPESILTISHDITERKKLEQKIQQQERLSAVGHLAAGIAHDFNNILSSTMLYTDILSHLPDMPPKAVKYLDILTSQNQQAANLVQQILDFGRRSALDKQPTDILLLLQELITLTSRTFPENITVALSHTKNQHLAHVDPTRIQQVLINLMFNARDAMPAGGLLAIGIEALEVNPGSNHQTPLLTPGHWQKITITDTGTGISEDDLPHLYEPFFTTKEPGTGTGLGLAQVYGIIQQHDGVIDVDSQLDQGTTFTLYLSYLGQKESLAPVSQPEIEVPFGNEELILLVEDNDTTREAIGATLETLNYRVIEASNGQKGLATLKESAREISLVICDMIMPTMSGVEFLRAMQAGGFHIPTIILSGYLPYTELNELRALGMSDWLAKPPTIEVLAQTIARNIERP